MEADLDGYPDSELVIHIEPGGIIRLVAEPTNRRLGRGEVLPEVKLDAVQLFNSRKPGKADAGNGELKLGDAAMEGKINAIMSKVAITHDEGTPAFYHAKAALLKAMKEVLLENKTVEEDTP